MPDDVEAARPWKVAEKVVQRRWAFGPEPGGMYSWGRETGWMTVGYAETREIAQAICDAINSADERERAARQPATLREEIEELRALFALQNRRELEAIARWRAEDPSGRELTMPDYGRLLDWMLARVSQHDALRDAAEEVMKSYEAYVALGQEPGPGTVGAPPKPEAEWDEYDYMMIPKWRALRAALDSEAS